MRDKFKPQRFLRNESVVLVLIITSCNLPASYVQLRNSSVMPGTYLNIGALFASLQSFTKVTGFTLKFCIVSSDLSTSSLLPAPLVLKSVFYQKIAGNLSKQSPLCFLPGSLDEKKPYSFSKPLSSLIAF